MLASPQIATSATLELAFRFQSLAQCRVHALCPPKSVIHAKRNHKNEWLPKRPPSRAHCVPTFGAGLPQVRQMYHIAQYA
jgi:hypothetical protein